MKELRLFKSVAASMFAAAILVLGASLTVACSSDPAAYGNENSIINETADGEYITFPIYVKGTQGSEETKTRAAKSENAVAWIAINGEEDINPEGWNDPLAEEEAAGNGKKKTQFAYNGEVNNDMYVKWSDGDQIGIKTEGHARAGTAQWTSLQLSSGAGNQVASFEGLASTANGLSPTGSQKVMAVHPFSLDGSYNRAKQEGLLGTLGRYDLRVDTGTLVNGVVTDLYFQTRISVLRLAASFFDNGNETKTIGKDSVTITVSGAGIGNSLTGVWSNSESVSAGVISATVALNPASGKPLEDVYLAFFPIRTDVSLFTVTVQSGDDVNTLSRYAFYKSNFDMGRLYNLRHPGTDVSESCIVFKDPKVESICLQNFDSNNNGCISYREARSVNYLGNVFSETDIQWFPELKEFTGLTMIPSNGFMNCLKLEEIEFPYSVTEVGKNAFNNCGKLEDVPGAVNVVSIGDNAFASSGIRSISTANLPNVVTIEGSAFSGCFNLESAVLPECTTIGGSAFYNCDKLTTAAFPECTTIGASAFNDCDKLTTATFPVCTTLGDNAFRHCDALPSASFPACTTIGTSAFYNCAALASVNFPVCTAVSNSAFENCDALTKVSATDFPVCTTIGTRAFSDCDALTSASFPVCTAIGANAFYNCDILARVSATDFPECKTIGANAFFQCPALATANFPKCDTIYNDAFSDCDALASASFPVCKAIGASAFYDCDALPSASFPACTTLGTSAFYDCAALATASFPECTTVDRQGFYNCAALATANFPKCTTIGEYAFYNCDAPISSKDFSSCTTIGDYAFCDATISGSVSFPNCTTLGERAFSYATINGSASFGGTTIGAEAFEYATISGSASFSTCTTIGAEAFNNATVGENLSFDVLRTFEAGRFSSATVGHIIAPACTTINAAAFSSSMTFTGGIAATDFPNCTTLGERAFENATIVSSVNIPKVQVIPAYCFYGVQQLNFAHFPACTTINDYAFHYCDDLNSIYFPECKTIGVAAFGSCGLDPGSLSYSNGSALPKVETISSQAFADQGGGSWFGVWGTISLPKCKYIGNQAFANFVESAYSYIDWELPAIERIEWYALDGIGDHDSSSGEEQFTHWYLGPNVTYIGTPSYSGISVWCTDPDYECSEGGVKLYLSRTTPPEIEANFVRNYLHSVYVPASSLSTYKTTSPWSMISSHIYAR